MPDYKTITLRAYVSCAATNRPDVDEPAGRFFYLLPSDKPHHSWIAVPDRDIEIEVPFNTKV